MKQSAPRFPKDHAHDGFALVFAAACTGSAQLSGMTGLPVIHVGVTRDRAAAIRRLNETAHGSGVRWPRSFQPLAFEPGWEDWAAFHLEPVGRNRTTPPGVHFVNGCIAASLPAGTTVVEFEAELSAAMRSMRLQDVVIRPCFLEALSDGDPLADVCVHPRYTARRHRDFRDATLVTDLFVLDPGEQVGRLLWLAAAARLAACEGSRTPWP